MIEHSEPEKPLTAWERWKLGSPLVATLFGLAGIAVVAPEFKKMFDDMELGELPRATAILFRSLSLLGYHPEILMTGMFLVFWVHLGWCCKKRSRAQLAFKVSLIVMALLCYGAFLAFFTPIIAVSSGGERMGQH